MKRQSEKLHKEIVRVMEDSNCDFIDAILEVCLEHQIDPDDLVKQMDDVTISRAKKCAIDNRLIRKSVLHGMGESQLQLE